MKILFDSHVLGKNKTGLNRYTTNVIQRLHETDVGLSLYTPRFPSGLYRIVAGFTSAVQSQRPDILHVQNFTPLVKTCPIVNTVHDLCFKFHPDSFSLKSRLAYFFFFKRSLMLSDKIIAVSDSVKKSLENIYNIDPKKIVVIYEASDKNFFYIQNKTKVKKVLLKKFSIRKPFFLVVGEANKRKNIGPIITAHKLLTKNYKDINLVFAGQDKANNQINKNNKYLGHVTNEDLNILYNGATALIMNSLCEGFGLPLVEAMACKTPIICNDIEVFREICDKSALYTKNAHDISWAMTYLLSKNNYTKYSQLSYTEGKRFSWDSTASKTISVYNEVLKGYEYTK